MSNMCIYVTCDWCTACVPVCGVCICQCSAVCGMVDSSAFSYVTLHPGRTEQVRILGIEDDGSIVCRPTSAVHDTAELQQKLQDIYASGIVMLLLLLWILLSLLLQYILLQCILILMLADCISALISVSQVLYSCPQGLLQCSIGRSNAVMIRWRFCLESFVSCCTQRSRSVPLNKGRNWEAADSLCVFAYLYW